MKLIEILLLLALSSCSSLPFIIEDVEELIEIEQIIEREIHHNDPKILCVLEPWMYESVEDIQESEETFQERMRNYSDYYNYHFNQYHVLTVRQ